MEKVPFLEFDYFSRESSLVKQFDGKNPMRLFWWFSNIERARKDKRILDLWFISGDWEAFLSSRQEWKWHLQPCGAQWKATSGLKAFEWPSILPNGIPLSRNGTKLSIAFRYFLLKNHKVKNRPKNSSKWRERIFQQFFRIVAKSFYQHLRGTDNAWVPSNLVIFPHHSQKKIECRSQKEKH